MARLFGNVIRAGCDVNATDATIRPGNRRPYPMQK
jgi:hypothetical protein